MAKVNENYLKLSGSYLFSTIAKKIREYEAAHPGAEILRLGIGDVTQPIAPAVIEALHGAVEEMGQAETFHGYAPDLGYAFLRDVIAREDFQKRGCDISEDEIFVSDGAKCDCGNIQEIFGTDNTIAVCDPVYPVYVDSNVMAGRTGSYDTQAGCYRGVIYMPCTSDNGFLPELPGEEPGQVPDLIYLCSPNNPTGAVMPKDRLQEWVDYANRHDSVILFDAAYEAYIQDDLQNTGAACEADIQDGVLNAGAADIQEDMQNAGAADGADIQEDIQNADAADGEGSPDGLPKKYASGTERSGYTAQIPHSIYECKGAKTCAIEFRSFSKTAGFTGLRLGYTVIPKELETGGERLWPLWARRHGTKYNGAPYIIQKAGAAVYSEAGRRQIREQIAYYKGNAACIYHGLKAAGYEVSGGVHAPYIWLRTPGNMTSWEFFDHLLNQVQVVGTPGSGFGPHGEHYFRLSAFGSRENTEKAVARICAERV